jgi:hypothetical protein
MKVERGGRGKGESRKMITPLFWSILIRENDNAIILRYMKCGELRDSPLTDVVLARWCSVTGDAIVVKGTEMWSSDTEMKDYCLETRHAHPGFTLPLEIVIEMMAAGSGDGS